MDNNELAAIVLAAGLGSRMKSRNAKVLCRIKGRPMVLRSVEVAVNVASSNNTIVVVGYQAENVKKIVSEVFDIKFVYQEKQIGTGDAVLCSIPFLSNKTKDIIILCGDLPLLSTKTIRNFIHYHKNNKNDISVLAANVPDPTGYGRILLNNNGNITKIIEDIDANEDERKNNLVNTGIFCVRHSCIGMVLKKIKRDNLKREMYLTDIIEIGYNYNLKLGVHVSPNIIETIGVNTPEELIKARIISETNMLN